MTGKVIGLVVTICHFPIGESTGSYWAVFPPREFRSRNRGTRRTVGSGALIRREREVASRTNNLFVDTANM